MVIGNHDNVISYVKLGPKALDFLQGRMRVIIFICFTVVLVEGLFLLNRESDALLHVWKLRR